MTKEGVQGQRTIIEKLQAMSVGSFDITSAQYIYTLQELTERNDLAGIKALYDAYREAIVRCRTEIPPEKADEQAYRNLEFFTVGVDLKVNVTNANFTGLTAWMSQLNRIRRGMEQPGRCTRMLREAIGRT